MLSSDGCSPVVSFLESKEALTSFLNEHSVVVVELVPATGQPSGDTLFSKAAEKTYHIVPFVSVPVGFSSAGLPAGLYVVKENEWFSSPASLSEKLMLPIEDIRDDDVRALSEWSSRNSFPLLPEVTAGNFRSLTNGRLAVIGAVLPGDTEAESFRATLKDAARKANFSSVTFSWLDADRWSSVSATWGLWAR